MVWGEQIDVTMSVGFLVNFFTLDDTTEGVLDNTTYVLDGNLLGSDVTPYVQSVSLRRGKSNELDNVGASTLSVTLNNNDRRFDPINTASEYYDVANSRSGVEPRRRVTLSSDTQSLFVGAITDIQIEYNQNLSTATINCADDFVLLANAAVAADVTPTVELSGARVTRILNLAEIGYSATTRDIATGEVQLAATVIEADTNALSYLQQCATAEQGLLFVARDGDLTFTDRLDTVFNYDVSATMVDSTNSSYSAGAIPYNSISTVTDQTFLYNKVITSTETSIEFVNSDATSQSTYGVSVLSLTGLLLDSATDANALGAVLVAKYKDPLYRFDDISFMVNGMNATRRGNLCTLDIGDTVLIVRSFSTGTPTTVEEYYQVERLEHTITSSQHNVVVGLGTLQTVIYQLILDDVTFGVLDGDNALS